MKILIIGAAGYIGNYLTQALTSIYQLDACDYLDVELESCRHYKMDYRNLSAKDINQYSWVLWFAGHSSVPKSLNDPIGALYNNNIGLIEFFQKTLPKKTKIIYASTGSLYSKSDPILKSSTEIDQVYPSANAYDISKFAFDYLAPNYFDNFYGLRMGTLSGFSKKLRPELIFNKMNIDAMKNGVINISNPKNSRSLLFLSDLLEIIKLIIKKNPEPGFYNAGSASDSIENFAIEIANYYKATLNYLPDSPSYSFALDCQKLIDVGFNPEINITNQIVKFQQEYMNAQN
jgi:nucleoside-diphosphate-sugar epimerase